MIILTILTLGCLYFNQRMPGDEAVSPPQDNLASQGEAMAVLRIGAADPLGDALGRVL